jgi:hypothetical protein
MRWLIPIALLGVLLVVSASSATTPLLNVKGTLVRSSATSDCYPGEPCDPLPPALYVVFSRAGKLTRARLGSNGSFALHLAPGTYAVSEAPPRRTVAPASLRVPRVGVIRPRLVERSA